jgi:hypothetical protein
LEKHPLTKLVLVAKGPFEEELRSLCVKLGIAKSVFFAGQAPYPRVWITINAAMSLSSPLKRKPRGLLSLKQSRAACPLSL